MACIYKIINLVNNKFYIGSTIRPFYIRRYEHLRLLRSGIHCNKHLQRAFNIYKEENFRFEIIEKISKDDYDSIKLLSKKIVEREFYFIKLLSPEYNIKQDTAIGHSGYKHTKETREKISNSQLQKRNYRELSKSTLIKINREIRRKEGKLYITNNKGIGNISTKGWKHSPEAIEKIRERSNKEDNIKRIKEIQKMASDRRIGQHCSKERKLKSVISRFGKRRDIQVYKDGELLYTCNFSSEASVLTNVKKSAIRNNLAGLSNSSGGYIFKYKEVS